MRIRVSTSNPPRGGWKLALVIIGALAVVNLALWLTAAQADTKPQTHLGLTAEQWHQRAVTRTKERNRVRGEVRMLTRHIARMRVVLKQLNKPYSTRPPHYAQWMCIHAGEGSWTANTGNGYYGGLQMDMTFQRTYGWNLLAAKGTANNWTPLEQMWVAERAHASGRGFYPWPTTARNCGLI